MLHSCNAGFPQGKNWVLWLSRPDCAVIDCGLTARFFVPVSVKNILPKFQDFLFQTGFSIVYENKLFASRGDRMS